MFQRFTINQNRYFYLNFIELFVPFLTKVFVFNIWVMYLKIFKCRKIHMKMSILSNSETFGTSMVYQKVFVLQHEIVLECRINTNWDLIHHWISLRSDRYMAALLRDSYDPWIVPTFKQYLLKFQDILNIGLQIIVVLVTHPILVALDSFHLLLSTALTIQFYSDGMILWISDMFSGTPLNMVDQNV